MRDMSWSAMHATDSLRSAYEVDLHVCTKIKEQCQYKPEGDWDAAARSTTHLGLRCGEGRGRPRRQS